MDDDHDDEPWADPAIQVGYEAALGRCLVSFNKIDNEVSEIIAMCLGKEGRPHLLSRAADKADFGRKVFHLELLSGPRAQHKLQPGILTELMEIAAQRNIVAHGHFDQNPYQGNYKLKGRGKESDYDVAKLDALTARCEKAWNDLRVAKAYYWFEGVTVLPPGAVPA